MTIGWAMLWESIRCLLVVKSVAGLPVVSQELEPAGCFARSQSFLIHVSQPPVCSVKTTGVDRVLPGSGSSRVCY